MNPSTREGILEVTLTMLVDVIRHKAPALLDEPIIEGKEPLSELIPAVLDSPVLSHSAYEPMTLQTMFKDMMDSDPEGQLEGYLGKDPEMVIRVAANAVLYTIGHIGSQFANPDADIPKWAHAQIEAIEKSASKELQART